MTEFGPANYREMNGLEKNRIETRTLKYMLPIVRKRITVLNLKEDI